MDENPIVAGYGFQANVEKDMISISDIVGYDTEYRNINKQNIICFAFDSDDDLDLLAPFFPEEPTKIKQKRGFTI